jgi:hypothetical protein
VLPIVSLSSDATLPAHNASGISAKTGKVAGAAAPAFRGAVPPANKAAAPRDKNATQAARPLLTADVCLTTKKGMAISNKASSKCHLPFRCLYNYTMEVHLTGWPFLPFLGLASVSACEVSSFFFLSGATADIPCSQTP